MSNNQPKYNGLDKYQDHRISDPHATNDDGKHNEQSIEQKIDELMQQLIPVEFKDSITNVCDIQKCLIYHVVIVVNDILISIENNE